LIFKDNLILSLKNGKNGRLDRRIFEILIRKGEEGLRDCQRAFGYVFSNRKIQRVHKMEEK
jgi:hypothetical protein